MQVTQNLDADYLNIFGKSISLHESLPKKENLVTYKWNFSSQTGLRLP